MNIGRIWESEDRTEEGIDQRKGEEEEENKKNRGEGKKNRRREEYSIRYNII